MSRILLIDDNLDLLAAQKMLLELEGHEVFVASSGAEGIRRLDEIGAPDLLVLDVNMPDMTGPEFLTWLDANRPSALGDASVVFLTALEDAPIHHRACGSINKMASASELIKQVSYFLNRS